MARFCDVTQVVSTGRFGLGFNATYHCTDLPSFVSNESLVIFDPHTKYLPGAEKHAPGQPSHNYSIRSQ